MTACAPHAPASGLALCSVSKDTGLLVLRPLGGPGLGGAEPGQLCSEAAGITGQILNSVFTGRFALYEVPSSPLDVWGK